MSVRQDGTNGAVTMTQTGTINLASGGGQQGLYSMYIDASQSSSIYKNNVNTVQPPAYIVNVWRRTA